MSWRRALVDAALWLAAAPTRAARLPENPKSIFVLRNNDIGDVLVATPLFRALRQRFPSARICAGVGPWSMDVLKHNPCVDEVLPVSAPWHNKQTARHPANSAKGWRHALGYIFGSGEARELRRRTFDIGIDVLGSPQGSLLLLRAGVRFRLGVRGYAGGHTACHRSVPFDPGIHVQQAALKFAEALGAAPERAARPELHLSDSERANAEAQWREAAAPGAIRVAMAPGGGFAEKCWPVQNFAQTAADLSQRGCSIVLVGGKADAPLAASIVAQAPLASDLTGSTTLRETFALIGGADLVICNSSMAMHAGAAFGKNVAVGLGRWYSDAAQHRRQWGYETDFIMLEPAGPESGPPHMLAAMERVGWLRKKAQAA